MNGQHRIVVRDCSITLARRWVGAHHRHRSNPPVGAFFALGAWCRGEMVGVALVGRTVARLLHNSVTAEVTRCCTDGTANACSALYGAARRAWERKAGRGCRLYSYTRDSEPGTSLRAAGAVVDGHTKGGTRWHRHSRPRKDAGTRNEGKTRWRLL